ncbi:MAG: hypothetical protein A4E28_00176 [Methanocella sp. PtaU1.Bin125]|nr:MAG: hypothetical protein A4E28_00176 [Methanocella sp. PtaU1.Bin125]
MPTYDSFMNSTIDPVSEATAMQASMSVHSATIAIINAK